jgi:hypothetical protein
MTLAALLLVLGALPSIADELPPDPASIAPLIAARPAMPGERR